jgi:hypothetical protein
MPSRSRAAVVSHRDGRQLRPALPRHRGTPWPAHTYLRYTVTQPCPASGRPVIPGLRGATVTVVEGSAFCITQTGGGILPGGAHLAATDSVLTLTAWRGERWHGLLIGGDGNREAAHRALSWGAAVPPRGQWLITVEAVPVRGGSPMTLHHSRGHPVEHARAASGVLRANCGPGQAANTPPGHGQRRGWS